MQHSSAERTMGRQLGTALGIEPIRTDEVDSLTARMITRPDIPVQLTLDAVRVKLARAEAAAAHKRACRLQAITAATARLAAVQERRRSELEAALGEAAARLAAAVARCESAALRR
jgi:hypothetical protein